MLKQFATLLIAVFSFFSIQIHSLTVNIISRDLFNEAGKEVDVIIIKTELENLGHKVRLFDYRKGGHLAPADINLFLAQFRSSLFSKAKLNWLLVNPDFYMSGVEQLRHFDLILCKTEESLRIFQSLNQPTYYLGFTSKDCYQSSVPKDYAKSIHVAGKSVMKGTDEVLAAWKNHPELPKLVLIKRDAVQIQSIENVELITKRVPQNSLLKLQNKCGIHICPSKTEGFGHYIMEAMSAGCVVVTTDAPPMNEFIRDKRCLVGYNNTSHKNLATTYIVNEEDLANTVKFLQQLSDEELQAIGQYNREEYLRRNAAFKQNFKELMKKAAHALRK
jgi:glycosyltransferase involved in cell wall biosynthesis